MAKSEKGELSLNEWALVAEWVKAEKERRVMARYDREQLWKEIDRQIALKPRKRDPGQKIPAWYPDTELPLQFNAVEVIMADARRLIFPRSGTWYRPSAYLSDEYLTRWQERREVSDMIGDVDVPIHLDQETADAVVRAAVDHFHKLYNFRASIDFGLAEKLKYGTSVSRVRPVSKSFFNHEYRGGRDESIMGPAVIPCSVWNNYPDDSWNVLMHEGHLLGPGHIRCGWQPLGDLERAVADGGEEDGWLKKNTKLLVGKIGPDGRAQQIEMLEYEGDILVPKSQGSIFLPNVIVTAAIGQGEQARQIVRFRKNPMPFRSYVYGHYFRHDMQSAYGESPLMKGEPLQAICTEAVNDLMAVARLNALPPVAYDRHDPNLAAAGGPEIYPGALWGTDAPNSIEPQQIGDPNALFAVYAGFVKQYEDTTGVNDPRRGQRMKSHTTAFAADVEAAQGISRTDDFVSDMLSGELPTILQMEYEIIKSVMKQNTPINISAEGIDGWITLSASDLPDKVEFDVMGAEGAVSDQQRTQAAIGAHTFALQTALQSAQLAVQVPVNPEGMIRDVYERSGIANTARFVGAESAVSSGAESESVIPGLALGTEQIDPATGLPIPPESGGFPGEQGAAGPPV